jgi:hypothetical protein
MTAEKTKANLDILLLDFFLTSCVTIHQSSDFKCVSCGALIAIVVEFFPLRIFLRDFLLLCMNTPENEALSPRSVEPFNRSRHLKVAYATT